MSSTSNWRVATLNSKRDKLLLERIALDINITPRTRMNAIDKLYPKLSYNVINVLALNKDEVFGVRHAATLKLNDVKIIQSIVLDDSEKLEIRRTAVRKLKTSDETVSKIAEDTSLDLQIRELAIKLKLKDMALLRKIEANENDNPEARQWATQKIENLIRR